MKFLDLAKVYIRSGSGGNGCISFRREKFVEFGLDARAFSGLKIAAVGGVTADALREWGLEPDLVPTGEMSARGLLEEWGAVHDADLPTAALAQEALVGRERHGSARAHVTAARRNAARSRRKSRAVAAA